MDCLKVMLTHFCGPDPADYPNQPHHPPEKLLANQASSTPTVRSDKEISQEVVQLLCITEKHGSALRCQLDNAVGAQGWTKGIARAILSCLETLVKEGKGRQGQVFDEAIVRAEQAAMDFFTFSQDHPYLAAGFVTIVAVGVLVYMAPWVIEVLGFGEFGPASGKFCLLPNLWYRS